MHMRILAWTGFGVDALCTAMVVLIRTMILVMHIRVCNAIVYLSFGLAIA